MTQPRSSSARKSTKKPPARKRSASIKDLPARKGRKIAGGLGTSTTATTVGTVPTVAPSIPVLPGNSTALL